MSRERIYQLLRERPESFFSGQELSRRLGISRAAVWKAIDALRRDGYTVAVSYTHLTLPTNSRV